MATTNQCLASLARLSLTSTVRPSATSIPRFLLPSAVSQARHASQKSSKAANTRKRKQHKAFKVEDLSKVEQFSLCDAIRYARAVEVGRPPTSVKYSLAIRLRTLKSGPVVRNRIRLPHPVKTDVRIAVICKEDSPIANEARMAGAVAVGEQSLFDQIRSENINFNRLICHTDSASELNKSGLGRILGPRGLMPSIKTKTITSNPVRLMGELVGADDYREREGTIRMAVGQLGFTPQMLADNVKALVGQVKQDIVAIEDDVDKQVHEIVLSSTNGPGFSLSGGFNPTDEKITPTHLAGPM
ncbi:Ribosomal protein L1 [Pleurostoma richardsiae]|uniref:Ribosomal protein L1 n=1 Tax=Pleurostoma richardsiae TaxID=41990 RepID=A0AA38R5J1_9PEZI|nr:Ribosomal protein L1 [Pleurostoma richardsiae]